MTGVDLDADRFTDLVTRARASEPPATTVSAPARGTRPVAGRPAVRRCHRRAGRCGGDPAPALRTVARELLAERLLQRGDREAIEEAAGLADLLAAQDPMRERGHELAILAAARARSPGRGAGAVRRAPHDLA